MAAQSVVALSGKVAISSNRHSTELTLMQSVANLEVKQIELTIPHAGVSPTAVGLNLSAGITEALFLFVSVPKTLKMYVTPTGGAEQTFQVKGTQILTFAPGGGLTALRFQNEDAVNDVVIEVYVGAKAAAADEDPAFWGP